MYNGRRQTTNKCTIHVSPITLIEKNVFTQPRWTVQQKRRVDNSKKNLTVPVIVRKNALFP